MSESPASKFSYMFARHFTDFGKMKPLFGKPYMMTGTLFGSLSFMFQTGAILGRHFRNYLEPFFLAFSVAEGHEEDGPRDIIAIMQRDVAPFVASAKSFNDLVIESERVVRYKDKGVEESFMLRQMQKKVKLEDAFHQNWEWLLYGAGFGVMYPGKVVELYNMSHKEVDAEQWKRMHDAGLNIPATQDVIPFDEQVQNDVQMFTEYVREYFPQYAEALGL